MKRVLLDVDGVLADFIGPVVHLASCVTGRTYTREDVTAFDFATCLGLTSYERQQVYDMISHSLGWWSQLPVLPGAREGVGALREIADVYIVTSPWHTCRTWLHDRIAWLRRHFDIAPNHVIVTSAKHLVEGDIFVDDRTSTLREWVLARREGRAVQWITPHNRRDGWCGEATCSWDELVRLVQEGRLR